MSEKRLSKKQSIAVCEDVVRSVNTAVKHQFALPLDVLGLLVSCQTAALRARFAATHTNEPTDPEFTRALNAHLSASAAFDKALDRTVAGRFIP